MSKSVLYKGMLFTLKTRTYRFAFRNLKKEFEGVNLLIQDTFKQTNTRLQAISIMSKTTNTRLQTISNQYSE